MDYPIRTIPQLGKILKALRNEDGLTQRDVAEKSGLLQKTVSLMEREPDRATVQSLFALISALDATLVIRPRMSVDNGDTEPTPPEDW